MRTYRKRRNVRKKSCKTKRRQSRRRFGGINKINNIIRTIMNLLPNNDTLRVELINNVLQLNKLHSLRPSDRDYSELVTVEDNIGELLNKINNNETKITIQNIINEIYDRNN